MNNEKDISNYSKQELIQLLKENDIVPDIRCSKEDLECLISDENIITE